MFLSVNSEKEQIRIFSLLVLRAAAFPHIASRTDTALALAQFSEQIKDHLQLEEIIFFPHPRIPKKI